VRGSLRRRLAEGETVLGTWVTLSDPACVEILCRAGFDFLLIDRHEAPVGLQTLRALLAAGNGGDTPLLARAAWNEPARIKHALDLGADGIMIPMVNSGEEAQQALTACKYPPAGRRSVGAWRASNYYNSETEYLERANRDTAVIIQIETAQAVSALDEILAVPGIDAVFIGPSDLAASLGHLGDPAHPAVQAAIRQIAEACRAAGIACGTDLGDPPQQAALGMRFFLAGMDILFLAAARATAAATRAALAS
jgi:2-keto-3-deoxy-L-rhamnonate aldolase RhmA